jgi:hypothetical protein
MGGERERERKNTIILVGLSEGTMGRQDKQRECELIKNIELLHLCVKII